MIRINLLPHREQKRQARQRQFVSLAIGLAILGAAVVLLVHVVFGWQIESQESRNSLLKTEIAKLDSQIKEIDKLREQTQALLARKQIVETLQSNRTEAVHLLDQMVRQLPDGIYLKSLQQAGAKVTLVGYAQSSARVSTLMRNIEASPWLQSPELVEIKVGRFAGLQGPPGQRVHAESPDQAGGPARGAQGDPGRSACASCQAAAGHSQRREKHMTLDDIRRLNIREAGNWPLLPKALLLLAILLAIVAAGAVLDWKDQYEMLDRAQQEETKLKEQFATKKAKAINYDIYVQQLKEIEQSFGALLKQLPNKAEMDALLTDINQAGLGRGLQFELFKPAAQERLADFYAELPITVKITGNYHDMGAFASDVAQLPRIVTLNDLVIANDKGVLNMQAVAKTFRYLDDEELAKQRKSAKDAKEKAKK